MSSNSIDGRSEEEEEEHNSATVQDTNSCKVDGYAVVNAKIQNDLKVIDDGIEEHVKMNPFPVVEDYHLQDFQHSSELLKGLAKLRENGQFCDAILCVDGLEIPCHRVVLSAFSHYFAALFGPNFKRDESESGIKVQLYSFKGKSLEKLIEYAYTGELTISTESVQDLLIAANYLQLDNVQEACCRFLDQCLEPQNCIGIHRFAKMLNCSSFVDTSWAFILRHFAKVSFSEEFLQLPNEELIQILRDKNICVEVEDVIPLVSAQEEFLCEAALKWLQYDPTSRIRAFEKVFECIRLQMLRSEYRDALALHPLLCKRANFLSFISLSEMSEPYIDRIYDKPKVRRGIRPYANRSIFPLTSTFGDPLICDGYQEYAIEKVALWTREWSNTTIVSGLKLVYRKLHIGPEGKRLCCTDGTITKTEDTEKVEFIHGGRTDDEESFTLEQDEKIIKVDVQHGWLIDSLKFYTNKGRELGPYGGTGGDKDTEKLRSGELGYLHGICGNISTIDGSLVVTDLQFVWLFHNLKKGEGCNPEDYDQNEWNRSWSDCGSPSGEFYGYDDFDIYDDYGDYEDLDDYEDDVDFDDYV